MKKTFILLLLLISSCSIFKENGTEIIIHNNTNSVITNIKGYTSEKLESITIDSLEPNGFVSKFLSMKNNKVDGHYILEFLDVKNNKKSSKDGYYSNGASFNEWIQYTIEEDTILVSYSESALNY